MSNRHLIFGQHLRFTMPLYSWPMYCRLGGYLIVPQDLTVNDVTGVLSILSVTDELELEVETIDRDVEGEVSTIVSHTETLSVASKTGVLSVVSHTNDKEA